MAEYNSTLGETSASIRVSKPTRDEMYLTSGKAIFYVSWSFPASQSSNVQTVPGETTDSSLAMSGNYYTLAGGPTGTITFSPDGETASCGGSQSGSDTITHTFNHLNPQSSYNFSASFTIKATYTNHLWSISVAQSIYHEAIYEDDLESPIYEEDEEGNPVVGEDGNPVPSGYEQKLVQDAYYTYTYKLEEETETAQRSVTVSCDPVTVYTRPGTFHWKANGTNFAADDIIGQEFVVDGGNTYGVSGWNYWAGKLLSWFNQSAHGSTNNTAAPSALITDSWYNNCASVLGGAASVSIPHVTGGPDGDIITASIINLLADAVSKS